MTKLRTESQLVPWRNLIILVVAGICIVLYLYLNRHDERQLGDLASLIPLPGDFGAYALRFASSLVLFAVVPMGIALLLGLRPRSFGLHLNRDFLFSPVFWLALVVLPSTAALSTLGTELETFYPFSQSLVVFFPSHPWLLPMHAGLYLLTYYLPWELLFRGLLLFPFLPPSATAKDQSWKELLNSPQTITLACWQMVPTVLIHYPHPFTETLGALPFGIIAALFAMRFRSIIPALIIHFLCGFAVDTIIILHTTRGF